LSLDLERGVPQVEVALDAVHNLVADLALAAEQHDLAALGLQQLADQPPATWPTAQVSRSDVQALIALRPGRRLGRTTLPTGTAGSPERRSRADSLGHELRAELLELKRGAQPGLDLADGQRDPRPGLRSRVGAGSREPSRATLGALMTTSARRSVAVSARVAEGGTLRAMVDRG